MLTLPLVVMERLELTPVTVMLAAVTLACTVSFSLRLAPASKIIRKSVAAVMVPPTVVQVRAPDEAFTLWAPTWVSVP